MNLSLKFLALCLSLSGSLGSSAALALPAQILIIRHAEKPDTGDDLSERGWQRANALVSYFEHNPAVTRFGTPVAIYAQNPNGSDSQAPLVASSRRAAETVTPLAKALGLPIHMQFVRDDYLAMLREVMTKPQYSGRMVLICWEHKVIPLMAEALGVNAPPQWPGSVFDWVWEIDFRPTAPSTTTAIGRPQVAFRTFWQHLLPGDH